MTGDIGDKRLRYSRIYASSKEPDKQIPGTVQLVDGIFAVISKANPKKVYE